MRKKKNRVLENVHITKYASLGKALARLEGKVLFVEGAVPGDVVDVLLTKNRKDWAEGRVLSVKQMSEERVKPFCIHFGTCGGCKWQMLPYELQLKYKEQEVRDVFRKEKFDPSLVMPIIGAAQTTAYRNKLEFTFSNKRYFTEEEIASGKELVQENALGYHVPRLFDKVINIQECWLMDEANDRIRNGVFDFAQKNNMSFYDIRAHEGWLRNLIIRYSSLRECMVNVVLGYEDKGLWEKLSGYLTESFPEISTLLYTINPKWNDSIYDLAPVIHSGEGVIRERLGKYLFLISPKSFFQTNTGQAKKLYDVVKDFAALSGKETVYDLYCGTGSIGIYLSDALARLVGVEVIPEAIADAKENARINGVEKAEFFAGDVIKICNDAFFEVHGRPDVVIVDPPRAGLHPALVAKLLEIGASRIVYVSCNIATQARDLKKLSEKYDVLKLQSVDMFPHTHHIECVALCTLGP